MMNRLKHLLGLAVALLCGFGLQAQNPMGTGNIVIEGANGARTVILGDATGIYPEFMTEDARYLSGMFDGGASLVYDFVKDSVLFFLEESIAGYISPDHYVGHGYTYYKGTVSLLEKTLDVDGNWGIVDVWAIQGNGEKIVTMVYDEVTTLDDKVFHVNRAALHDGKTGKHLLTLPSVWQPDLSTDMLGFGSRGDCISGDGMIIGGHSANPAAKWNWSMAFWDISDPDNIKAFGLGEGANITGIDNRSYAFGSFYGANYDGSLIVGGSRTNTYGVIIHYDRQHKVVSQIDTIAPLPSWELLTFTGVTDDGLVIGYCGMELDPITREAVVYSPLTGLVKMSDFLYEYYDIDARKVDLNTPVSISRDGKRIVGFSNDGFYPVPYTHELSEERILPRARKISARAARGELKAAITWQEPLVSEHTLKGYNIYLDSAKTPLNNALLPVTTNTYTDTTVSAGKHTYYVEAVYTGGVAYKQESNRIQVVGAGSAFPVQTIDHRVDYNRFANLYWGVPSSEVMTLAKNDRVKPAKDAKGRFERSVESDGTPVVAAAMAETKPVPAPKSYINTSLDYIANVDMLTYSGFAAVKIGDYYYTSSHTGGGITVIDQFNEKVKVIYPENLGIVMSMVYLEKEDLLYCGTSKDIKVLNLKTEKIVNTYPAIPARFLAYVPDVDGQGNEGFVAGSAHECNTYVWEEDEDGVRDLVLKEKNYLNFGSLYADGAAYYKGRLYIASASGPYMNEVYVYDFAKREQIGEPIQVVEDPALYDLLTNNGDSYLVTNLPAITQAGGLSVCQLEDGTTALGMVFQCMYLTSRFMLLELESAETVAGYDLYRSKDGGVYEKINNAPLTSRRYAEVMDQAGQYTYYVVVKSENGAADAEPSPVDTVIITGQGTCPAPDLTIRESNRWPVLDWMPAPSDKGLVGFELYRDDARVGRFWLNDMRLNYVDDAVTELGTYTYRLEVLYADGCMAEKTADITLTGQGVAKAPFGLTLSATSVSESVKDVTAKWETPVFEEPLSLRFCNGLAVEQIGFDNFYECWGVIGWNKANLALYKDLYLVGMEYGIGAVPKSYEAIVILNDEIVYTQPVARPVAGEFQTVMFNRSFPMDQPQEVAVGFHTKYDAATAGVLIVDPTVTSTGGNIVSLDGYQWSTLKAGGLAGNWTLGALVVHKRDLEAAKKADGTVDGIKLAGSIMRLALEEKPLDAKIETLPTPAAFSFKPSAKSALDLTGFNIYRKNAIAEAGTEVKLNDALLTTFEWVDKDVVIYNIDEGTEYEYIVGAVYSDGQEIKTSKFIDLVIKDNNEDLNETLHLNVYPNPATEWLNVEGEYETLQIFDFGGRLLRSVPAATQIQLGDLKTGTYFLHFTGADARKAVYKIVVR